MVCPRCIQAVEKALQDLSIVYQSVELGTIELEEKLSSESLNLFREKVQSIGFEVLEDRQSKIISQIKALLISIIQDNKNMDRNISDLLSKSIGIEYSSLSKLFSQVEGQTIERYYTRLKIEKVKELIIYDEKSLSEIAFDLYYSSTAYLSAQFKKETGMTPSQFRKMNEQDRKNLNDL